MSKIIRNGIEYGGTATTANQVQYSPTETVAEKIDELSDFETGSCVLNTTNVTSGKVDFSRIGKMVIISGYVLPSNGDNQAVIFTLPYAPVSIVNSVAQSDGTPSAIHLAINANELTVRTGAHAANSYIRFSFVYIKATSLRN